MFDNTMNRHALIFHLREAAEQLNDSLKAIERHRPYNEAALELAMGHIYHHLNTAWNGRNQTGKQFAECSEKDFNQFRKFPKESEFVYFSPLKRRKPSRRRRGRASVSLRISSKANR